ncbi:hypothetical protein [Paenibacillus sp. YIM B09110]|uniref:hypothetical protein n=1 Tax=Paenibacillus sp. YIM B09110 TaxID=3126102 RepID=UPI00301B705D
MTKKWGWAMAKGKDKWRKWKIGAGSVTAVMMLLGAIQNSETFKLQVLAKSQEESGDSYVAGDSGSDAGFSDTWQSGSRSYGRGNGDTGSSDEGGEYWSERESTSGMSSRTGKS